MPVIAGTWNLKTAVVSKGESTFALGPSKAPPTVLKNGQPFVDPASIRLPTGHGEVMVTEDNRKFVGVDAFNRPDGKYRSIVKLFMRYEHQEDPNSRAMGTGWLIQSDLLVTSGHCAYDWGDDDRPAYGRAIEVMAYIGYNGKDSTDNKTVVKRNGIKIVTTDDWLRTGDHQHDVAFIKLDKEFPEITPWTFKPTPTKGSALLGIVGYAGDKDNEGNGDFGAQMFEEFKNVVWNLDEAPGNMLRYNINSFGGQSGSPVLLKDPETDSLFSLGTNIYGANGFSIASAISTYRRNAPPQPGNDGSYGNPYDLYISVFESDLTPKETIADVSFIDITPR